MELVLYGAGIKCLIYCPGLSEKWAEEFSSDGQAMIGTIILYALRIV